MSNGYEFLYIISSANKEQEINKIIKTIEDQLKAAGANILYHQGWPALTVKKKNINLSTISQSPQTEAIANNYLKQKFAYPLAGEIFGYYVLCYFKIKTEKLAETVDLFSLNKQILRFNILKHNNIERKIQRYLQSISAPKQHKFPPPGHRSVAKPILSDSPRTTEIIEEKIKPKQTAIKSKKIKIQEELKQEKVDLEKIDEELENILKGDDLDING